MAGHFGRHLLRSDANVEKFAIFRDNLVNYYKLNTKAAAFAVLFLGAIPVALTYVGYKYQTVNMVSARREKNPYETENNWVPRS